MPELALAGMVLAAAALLLALLLVVGVPLAVFWFTLFKLVGRLRQAGTED